MEDIEVVDDPEESVSADEEIPEEGIVKVNGKTLVLNRDYIVSYRNNVNLGTAKILMTGIESYTGIASTTFKIVRKPLTDASVRTKATSYVYIGKARCPKPIIKVGNRTLTLGTNYTLSYKNNVQAGTATVNVKGNRQLYRDCKRFF